MLDQDIDTIILYLTFNANDCTDWDTIILYLTFNAND